MIFGHLLLATLLATVPAGSALRVKVAGGLPRVEISPDGAGNWAELGASRCKLRPGPPGRFGYPTTIATCRTRLRGTGAIAIGGTRAPVLEPGAVITNAND